MSRTAMEPTHFQRSPCLTEPIASPVPGQASPHPNHPISVICQHSPWAGQPTARPNHGKARFRSAHGQHRQWSVQPIATLGHGQSALWPVLTKARAARHMASPQLSGKRNVSPAHIEARPWTAQSIANPTHVHPRVLPAQPMASRAAGHGRGWPWSALDMSCGEFGLARDTQSLTRPALDICWAGRGWAGHGLVWTSDGLSWAVLDMGSVDCGLEWKVGKFWEIEISKNIIIFKIPMTQIFFFLNFEIFSFSVPEIFKIQKLSRFQHS
jgi:hypothetical protein